MIKEEKENITELKWLAGIRKGDEKAFEKLFHRYYLPLTRFVWRYTGSTAIAEELAQDLFCEIWEERETWTPVGRLRPYLYRKMKEKGLNHIKHVKVKRKYDKFWMEESASLALSSDDTDSDEQMKIFREALGQAVENLPHRCKMIFKLHKHDGLTYEEIAGVMGVSQKTVESQMTRALKMLRQKLINVL